MATKCTIKTANTADSRCKIEMVLYRKVIITPVSAIYTGIDSSGNEITFEEWLENGIHAADPKQRFYPMPEIRNVEDNTEDNTEWTDGYGTTYVIREGNFSFTQSYAGDSCLTGRLLKFNSQTFRAIIFDNIGSAQVVRTSNGIAGELCYVWASQPRANTSSEYSQPTIRYTFTSPNEHKLREVISTDVILGDLRGLEDISMNIAKDTTNYNIKFSVLCSDEDVTSELAALSGEASAWVTEGGNLSTAPIYNSSTQTFTIALTALASNTKIGIATPDILYGLGIDYKDGGGLTDLPV